MWVHPTKKNNARWGGGGRRSCGVGQWAGLNPTVLHNQQSAVQLNGRIHACACGCGNNHSCSQVSPVTSQTPLQRIHTEPRTQPRISVPPMNVIAGNRGIWSRPRGGRWGMQTANVVSGRRCYECRSCCVPNARYVKAIRVWCNVSQRQRCAQCGE